jgi:hypothetical protein
MFITPVADRILIQPGPAASSGLEFTSIEPNDISITAFKKAIRKILPPLAGGQIRPV